MHLAPGILLMTWHHLTAPAVAQQHAKAAAQRLRSFTTHRISLGLLLNLGQVNVAALAPLGIALAALATLLVLHVSSSAALATLLGKDSDLAGTACSPPERQGREWLAVPFRLARGPCRQASHHLLQQQAGSYPDRRSAMRGAGAALRRTQLKTALALTGAAVRTSCDACTVGFMSVAIVSKL